MQRKLAAIFSTDVAGYSRLMGDDEEATIRTLTASRAVISSLIQQYRGRVVDAPGDNLLAEFASVVNAVRCAVEIQHELNFRVHFLAPIADWIIGGFFIDNIANKTLRCMKAHLEKLEVRNSKLEESSGK